MARILVINRDPQMRKFFAISLGAGGHKVAETAAAAEGVALSAGKKFDLVILDLDRRIITRGGKPVHLTKREFDLLRVLASSPGHVLPHRRLVKLAWGTRAADEAARLRVYINQLRQKLETDPSTPRIIVTEIGVGYRLRSDGDAR